MKGPAKTLLLLLTVLALGGCELLQPPGEDPVLAKLDELERRDMSTALVTLCIGAGMGTATIIERV